MYHGQSLERVHLGSTTARQALASHANETMVAVTELDRVTGAFALRGFLGPSKAAALHQMGANECGRRGTRSGYLSGNLGPLVAVFGEDSLRGKGQMSSAPREVTALMDRAVAVGAIEQENRPFQVSVNHYNRGKSDEMVPHKDGTGSRVLIVSVGARSTISFYAKPLAKGQPPPTENRAVFRPW